MIASGMPSALVAVVSAFAAPPPSPLLSLPPPSPPPPPPPPPVPPLPQHPQLSSSQGAAPALAMQPHVPPSATAAVAAAVKGPPVALASALAALANLCIDGADNSGALCSADPCPAVGKPRKPCRLIQLEPPPPHPLTPSFFLFLALVFFPW